MIFTSLAAVNSMLFTELNSDPITLTSLAPEVK